MPNEEMPVLTFRQLSDEHEKRTGKYIGQSGVAEIIVKGAEYQRDADLAILRAERLKEAEWLEKWYEKVYRVAPITDLLAESPIRWQELYFHIASLKGEGEKWSER